MYYLYIDIYISEERKNITLAKLPSGLLPKCVFVVAQSCIYVSAENDANVKCFVRLHFEQ